MRKRFKKKDETETPHGDSSKEEWNEGEGSHRRGEVDSEDNEKMLEEVDRFLDIALSLGDGNCPPNPPEIPNSSVERLISMVEKEVSKYKPDSHDDWKSSLLDSVERLSSLSLSVSNFTSDPNYRKTGNITNKAVIHAMSFLEDEFRLLLETYQKKPVGENTTESSAVPDADEALPPYPPETIDKLQRIAKMMISAGYDSECGQTFSVARRKALDDRLSDIGGFGKMSAEDVQKMPWQTLGGEIVTWIRAFRESISSLLPQERALCESVFSNHRSIAGTLFSNLARGFIVHLLNFAEAVAAMTNRSAERLFKVLNMYETLTDMTATMYGLFLPGEDGEAADILKTEISGVRARIGEAAAAMFHELESSIKTDAPKSAVPGGAVHPLTRYVMNYLEYACEFTSSLEQIFTTGGGSSSSFAEELVGVMDLLDANIVSKSKLYKETALSYIFLMNNGRYIAKKIKESPKIFGVLGNNWYRKKSTVLQEYHKNYQRETWSKVLGCLKDEGLHVKGSVSKQVLKERLKSFNAMVEEIRKTQRIWVVSDEQLQSELRISISAVVVPAYRSFLGRYGQYLNSGKQPEKYIKFSPEDLETYIDELFVGNASNHGRKRT